MSTTSLTAAEVMDRSAALLNDPAKTDYTYVAQLPYLNMAIDELVESLEESNSSPTNTTADIITIPKGADRLSNAEYPTPPHYPTNLVEVQEISERGVGTNDPFIPLTRADFIKEFPPVDSLLFWAWENQIIRFNPAGATRPIEVRLKFVAQQIQQAINEHSVIGTINARSYLGYKTAAFCAMFIGENETRAQVLEAQAEKALERITSINNKGRQQIMTRHRPFRANFKSRGW